MTIMIITSSKKHTLHTIHSYRTAPQEKELFHNIYLPKCLLLTNTHKLAYKSNRTLEFVLTATQIYLSIKNRFLTLFHPHHHQIYRETITHHKNIRFVRMLLPCILIMIRILFTLYIIINKRSIR